MRQLGHPTSASRVSCFAILLADPPHGEGAGFAAGSQSSNRTASDEAHPKHQRSIWPAGGSSLLLLVAYTFYNLGPIFWLIISSLKSRVDLFSMPPKAALHARLHRLLERLRRRVQPAARRPSACSICWSTACWSPRSAPSSPSSWARSPAMSARASISGARATSCSSCCDTAHAAAGRRAGLLPPDVRAARLGRHAHRADPAGAIFANVGLATWIMKGFFDGVPREVEQIAIVNGYSRMYAFTRLVPPMVKDGIGRVGRLLLHLRLGRVRLRLDPDHHRRPRRCR